MNEKATIFDLVRFRKAHCNNWCKDCPIGLANNGELLYCQQFLDNHTDKANEIILDWCKEHPAETRQSRFLMMFPAAETDDDSIITVCPKHVDVTFKCCSLSTACNECRKAYWLAEA